MFSLLSMSHFFSEAGALKFPSITEQLKSVLTHSKLPQSFSWDNYYTYIID